jgi:hypothetical protein
MRKLSQITVKNSIIDPTPKGDAPYIYCVVETLNHKTALPDASIVDRTKGLAIKVCVSPTSYPVTKTHFIFLPELS